jgi:hypothetical protein
MVLHIIVLSAICDIREKRNNYNTASSESVKDLFKWHIEESKLVHLDKVLYMWFPALCSKGSPVTGLMIIDKAVSLFD